MKRTLPFLLGLSLIGSVAFANEPAPTPSTTTAPSTEKVFAKKPVKKTQKLEKKDPAK